MDWKFLEVLDGSTVKGYNLTYDGKFDLGDF